MSDLALISLTWPVRRLQLMMAPRRRSVQKICVGPRAMPHGSARPVATSHTRLPSRLAHCTWSGEGGARVGWGEREVKVRVKARVKARVQARVGVIPDASLAQ